MKSMWTFCGVLAFAVLISSGFSAAQSEQVLYSFTSADYIPAGVIFDNQGNLYGVATGAYGRTYGRVFELSPSANGWTETVLYTFKGGADGYGPSETESLAFDAAGNLYGTTVYGGKGAGTVFRLSPAGGGKWTETVLHRFLGSEGAYPETGVTIAAGKLYGTTTVGTTGSIFEMSPQLGYRVIHRFGQSVKNDGSGPMAALTADSAGNLYGTTYQGGVVGCGLGGLGCGTVFKLTPTSSGGWRYKQIYSFQGGSDGVRPFGGVVVSPAGILYGTTWLGGIGTDQCFSNAPGCGTVFELSPNTDGSYTHNVIYTFLGPPTDGGAPQGLILDSNGNLFGTTQDGGAFNSGTVFELVPQGSGWQETVLHSFGNGSDGQSIDTQPIMDASGNIYGTTYSGGANGYGTVFEVTP